MLATQNPSETNAWHKLSIMFMHLQAAHLRDLFHEDPQRFEKFSLQFEDILVDYSKNLITEEVMTALLELAREMELPAAINAMFEGAPINQTEHRAVLHTALRNRSNAPVFVDGVNVMPDVDAVLAQMKTFSDQLQSGAWKGYSGKPVRPQPAF